MQCSESKKKKSRNLRELFACSVRHCQGVKLLRFANFDRYDPTFPVDNRVVWFCRMANYSFKIPPVSDQTFFFRVELIFRAGLAVLGRIPNYPLISCGVIVQNKFFNGNDVFFLKRGYLYFLSGRHIPL